MSGIELWLTWNRMKQSEYIEQCKVVEYCHLNKIPVFAIPNSNAMSSKNRAMACAIMNKNKKAGLSKGVPDLFIPIANSNNHGLFIEMKALKGIISKEQKEWIELLNKNGYQAVVCYGYESAIKTINYYIKETK